MIYITKNTINLLLVLILIISINSEAFAAGEYSSLPKLDGKYDLKINSDNEDKSAQEPSFGVDKLGEKGVNSLNKAIEPKLDLPVGYDKKNLQNFDTATNPKIATKSDKLEKNTIGTSNSPQLDLLSPKIKGQYRESSLSFRKYKKDLKEMLGQLIEIKAAIDKGLPIQEYSAMASNIKFMNELFIKKYKDKPECHYETYRLVQDAVNSAIYVKDYWFNTNKITYNLNGIPEKVIQTKFLKVATSVDKLVEIIEMETALNEE